MPTYVGMAIKQNGGYNASISVQTPILHLVANSTHLSYLDLLSGVAPTLHNTKSVQKRC